MIESRITVVFVVRDREQMKDLWSAHKDDRPICGMIPAIIAWGDQVTTPGLVVEMAANLDAEHPNKCELSLLCETASKHTFPRTRA